LTGLTRRNLVRELLAGVTLLAIAIPLNIGYAQIAGLPPTAGLYALIVPTVAYALVVSSRQLGGLAGCRGGGARGCRRSAVSPWPAAPTMRRSRWPRPSSAVRVFVLSRFFKLGFLANFLSKPILVGSSAGSRSTSW
jgi:MFS superfamily sulfate permease-like transporter